jgi:hypothetical protein
MRALVGEAMRKAAVAWVQVGTRPAYPVWCHWSADALYVVSGAGEQAAPGLARAVTATVTARGDHGGAIVSWPARVDRLRPDDPDWPAVAPQLAARRLNGASGAELVLRWATDAAICRLTPLA